MESHQINSPSTPCHPNYLWVAIVFGLLVLVLTFCMDRIMVGPAILVVIGCIVFPALKPGFRISGCLGFIALGVLIAIATPNCGGRIINKAKNARVKQNLYAIQLSLEKYAADYGNYPATIQDLLADDSGYLFELPENPYKVYQSTQSEIPWIPDGRCMVPINEAGWPDNWDEHAGDFFYFPIMQQVNGELVSTDYDLLALGGVTQNRLRETLLDVKGAVPIIHLGSSRITKKFYSK